MIRKIRDFYRMGNIAPVALAATAILAFLTIIGITVIPPEANNRPQASMYIEPDQKTVKAGDKFEIQLLAESEVPVNVFAGEIHFDPEMLFISNIDYNTSVADLWAELPWYSNGEGTLTFGGGTTRPGGFTGKDTIIKVMFTAKQTGGGSITIKNPRMLLHDGLGTDAKLGEVKDTVFFVEETEANDASNLVTENENDSLYKVVEEAPTTDLNGDGKQSVADVSIFMLNMAGNDPKHDFNLDGKVNLKDLNILLAAE